jgi:hypothetical protein
MIATAIEPPALHYEAKNEDLKLNDIKKAFHEFPYNILHLTHCL